jgi:hypothetical protein
MLDAVADDFCDKADGLAGFIAMETHQALTPSCIHTSPGEGDSKASWPARL